MNVRPKVRPGPASRWCPGSWAPNPRPLIPSICYDPETFNHHLFAPSTRGLFAVLYPAKSRAAVQIRSDTKFFSFSIAHRICARSSLVATRCLPVCTGSPTVARSHLIATQHVYHGYCLPLSKSRQGCGTKCTATNSDKHDCNA